MAECKGVSIENSALFTANELRKMETVTIPRAEYNFLVKKALLLDMALISEPAKYGYEKEQILNVCQKICEEGWLEC